MAGDVLRVEDLDVTYRMEGGRDVSAVSNCTFEVAEGEYFGLVGESGCGKSTVARSIIGTLDDNGEVTGGRILFDGEPIQDYTEREYRRNLRWKEISFIPQASMNSLDPLMEVSEQALEIGRRHTDWSDRKIESRLAELFEVVGLSESRTDEYPHQFSGGMEQRAVIALSLFLEPSLVIADEPTTALDVIMQDRIFSYFDEIKSGEFSMLLITHDMSVILENCDSMAILHGGQVAESGDVGEIHRDPAHPYTKLLQEAFPDIRHPGRELLEIEGNPPELTGDVDYCTFADRCPLAIEECRADAPPLEAVAEGSTHRSSCIRSDEVDTVGERDAVADGTD